MRTVNHYIANYPEKNGVTITRYQGVAENEDEFITMCRTAGYDLEGLCIVENRRNCRNEIGQPIRKQISEW